MKLLQVLSVPLAFIGLVLAQTPCPPPVVPIYGQCGGLGWTGPTTQCVGGYYCYEHNVYYSQCLPIPVTAPRWAQCGGNYFTGPTDFSFTLLTLSMAQYSPCPSETIANYGQCAGACFSICVSPSANALAIKGLAGVVRPTNALKDTTVFGTIQTIPSAYPTPTQLTQYVYHLNNTALVLNANALNSGISVEVSFSLDPRTVNMGIIAFTEMNSSRSAGQRIRPAGRVDYSAYLMT
ncbi:hypothetical protein ONZ45_g12389 [Pleurotus djamor]|nr:hypothetical protein ONZ45_g12389 [Pleurotus djamor]